MAEDLHHFRIDPKLINSEEKLDEVASMIAAGWIDSYKSDIELLGVVYGTLESVIALQPVEGGEDIRTNPMAEVACHRGCSFCCYMHVEVTRQELDLIDSAIRKAMAPVEQALLRAKISRVAQLGAEAEKRYRMHIACPFLDERTRMCTIYNIRPFACRAHHSKSVKVCKEDLRECTSHVLEHQVVDIVLARAIILRAYIKTLEAVGQPHDFVELSAGLYQLFTGAKS